MSCGTGACAADAPACVGGQPSAACTPLPPSPESCNGVDDDCNGAADDGLGTLSCGVGGCARTVPACDGGAPGSCVPGSPAPARGDGVDDDCNGQVDDGLADLACGVGACARTAPACAGGVPGSCVPGAPGVESCNGIDDDCDGAVDEGVVGTWFQDADFDGFGTPFVSQASCTRPPGYVADGTDCDDGRSDVHPGAAELCDGVDDDCSGATADGSGEAWFGAACDGPDADRCAEGTFRCTGGVQSCSDATFDDVESCNGLDDDCDGAVDEGVGPTWFRDQDGDGFGAAAVSTQACAQPPGHVADATDCDDARAAVHPGALELCDGLDTDCAPATADGAGEAWFGAACDGADADLCPEGTYACVGGAQTCSDVTGATGETCNGADDDCDGQIDEGANGCGGVCVLADAPGTPCDASGPVDLDACGDDAYACNGANATTCADVDTDADGDGFSAGLAACGGDCDDAQATRFPGAAELCNGTDDDCDGTVDEGVTTTYFRDADGDGFGDPNVTAQGCSAPAGHVPSSTDCDDARSAVHPGAPELCDGRDTDCNPATADGAAEAWLGAACDGPDSDACLEGTFACVGGAQTCSDTSGSATESCNGADDDCDGEIDEGANGCGGVCPLANAPGSACDLVGPGDLDACADDAYVCSGSNATVCANAGADADGDGYSAGAVACGGDCADANASRNPGAAEVCDDGADDDCDGSVDEGCAVACDPDGVWTVSVPFSYSCAFGLVSLSIDSFTFANDGATITPSPSQPGPGAVNSLTGPATTCPVGNIANNLVYPGTCTETYTLTGSFVDANTWTGTYTAQYAVTCFGCTTQSWPVTATRP